MLHRCGRTSHHDADHHSRACPIHSPSSAARTTCSAAQPTRVPDAAGTDLPLLHSAISPASCHSHLAARSSAPRRGPVGFSRRLTYRVNGQRRTPPEADNCSGATRLGG
ncbi:hypothetical protein C8Q73DRAFT_76197 [Cubamyces lactineus]|nr:hypothetical protein C8Q73DRAFT_76197 [Cubamyces lactineus]